VNGVTVEQYEVDGVGVFVVVAPFPFTAEDMVTVAGMLPEGAFCTDVEIDGTSVYTHWIG
jgi:hypothetical protein